MGGTRTLIMLVYLRSVSALFCNSHDCYALLKASRTDSEKKLKKLFRKAVSELHAQLNVPNLASAAKKTIEESIQQVTTAHRILTDPETRKMYDLYQVNPIEALDLLSGASYVYPSQMNILALCFILMLVAIAADYTIKSSGRETFKSHIRRSEKYAAEVSTLKKAKLKKRPVLTPEMEEEIEETAFNCFVYPAAEWEFSWDKLVVFRLCRWFNGFLETVHDGFNPDFTRYSVNEFDKLSPQDQLAYVQNCKSYEIY